MFLMCNLLSSCVYFYDVPYCSVLDANVLVEGPFETLIPVNNFHSIHPVVCLNVLPQLTDLST